MESEEVLYFKIMSRTVPAGMEGLTVRALDEIGASVTVVLLAEKGVCLCELVRIGPACSFLEGFLWRGRAYSWFIKNLDDSAFEITRYEFVRWKRKYEDLMRAQYPPPVVPQALYLAE